jgi:penicillin-binding protein 2
MKRTGRVVAPRKQRERRSLAARGLVVLAILFLGTALFRLQVVEGEQYAMTARENRLRELPIPAPRGTIYDRTGRVVAENVPGYMIQLMPGDADVMNATIEQLRPLLGLSDTDIQRARRRWTRQRHLPMVLLHDAPETAVAALAERRFQFPNVLVHEYAKRRYPAGEAIAHFIGYVNEINDRQLQSREFEGYSMGQWIGQAGLERQYERRLGGVPGKRFLEMDARATSSGGCRRRWACRRYPAATCTSTSTSTCRSTSTPSGRPTRPAPSSPSIPQTGGVLAYYSYPTYDPNIWIGGISQTDYDQLFNDRRLPLLDRVVASGQPAASTWKLAVAGMALDLGVIRPDEYMPQPCTGSFFYGRTARCWYAPGHGRQNLIEAIKNSCNVYFYQVGVRIGLQRFLETGTRLGFGQRTGIDVPHEIAPNFPEDLDYYRRTLRLRALRQRGAVAGHRAGPDHHDHHQAGPHLRRPHCAWRQGARAPARQHPRPAGGHRRVRHYRPRPLVPRGRHAPRCGARRHCRSESPARMGLHRQDRHGAEPARAQPRLVRRHRRPRRRRAGGDRRHHVR